MAIQGLKRLIAQGDFTESKLSQAKLEEVQRDTNSVAMFMYENGYLPAKSNPGVPQKIGREQLWESYQQFCAKYGYAACNERNFTKRLVELGFEKTRLPNGPAGFEVVIDLDVINPQPEETEEDLLDKCLNTHK